MKLYAFGDSIVAGHLYTDASFIDFVAKTQKIELVKFAVNGATIRTSSNDILTQIISAPGEIPDMLLFNGGTNDAFRRKETLALQKEPKKDTFFNSFAEAFRDTIEAMQNKWPQIPIIYVAVHKLGGVQEEIQLKLRKIELDICADCGVIVADIWKAGLYTGTEIYKRRYSFDTLIDGIPTNEVNVLATPTGTHPNFAAIEAYYVPVVTKAIKKAGCGYKCNGACLRTSDFA